MARGHICKRGKSYSVVIYLGKDTNGKKHQKWYTCKTKKEAESLLVTKLSELENGTFILNDDIILSDFLNYWYSEYCLKKLSATTYESYKRNIDNYIIPNLGNIKIKDLKPLHLQNFYNTLLKNLSKTTVSYIHKILHKALKHAVQWELVLRNVADVVSTPTPEKYVANVLKEDEISTLLDSLKNTEIYLAVLIALGTGLRRGEILALTWDCIDLENKTLTVSKTVEPTKNGLTVKSPKTHHSNRKISISDNIIIALNKELEKQNIQKSLLKENYMNNNLVFCRYNGDYYSPTKLNHTFKKYIDNLNITKIRFHDLRHTHASLLLKDNVNFKIISERLGHSNINITLDTYAHTYEATNISVAQNFNKYLE